jgi:hypothetical protein
MAYEPKMVKNSAGEPMAFGFKDIGASPDGKFARIVFVAKDETTEIPIQLAADLLDKMMPTLLGVAAECERRRTGGNPRRAYNIKQGSVGKSGGGGIVFEFVISTGQHFSFEMDKLGAKLVLDSLSEIMNMIESKGGQIETPTKQ